MEGLVVRTNHKGFFFFSASPRLCQLTFAHSPHTVISFFLATQPKSRFKKLSILIEIINPFYSFPDFHFVRSIIEEKGAIESSICAACSDI